MTNTQRLLTQPALASEAIVKVLEEAGIDMVFGIQGGNMGRLYDALYDRQDSVRAVLVRHEQLASVMAEVYGRLTGKPGVVIGQGIFILANGLLGTLEAQFGSSPMLLLTDFSDVAPFTKHAPYQTGSGDYGGVDTRQTLAGVTKRTMVANTPTEAAHVTQFAIKHALSGERGPVAVVYHSNCFLGGTIDPEQRPYLYSTNAYLPTSMPAAPLSVQAAAQAIVDAKQPVVIAGNGVRIAQAYRELDELARVLGAPVATSASGKSVYPETGDWALGVCGNFGQSTANSYIGSADLVIAVGTRLGAADTAHQNPAFIDPLRQRLVQIDIESKNASWTFPVDHVVIGDAALALQQIVEAVRDIGEPASAVVDARKSLLERTRDEEKFFNDPGYTSDDQPIMPQRVFAALREVIDEDAIVTCDAGENRLFMTHFFRTKGAGTLLMPGIGAMGYALPAALAAKLVYPARQVIAVCGDGGFSMAINGIMTARDEDIPVVTVILNNSALGWVKHGQGNRTINSSFANMDFAGIAEKMGCKGIRVEDPADLDAALREAFAANQPTVIDVITAFDGLSFRDVTTPLLQG